MRWRLYSSVVLLAVVGCGWARGAQVTIENPKNLPSNEDEVSLLYTMVCQQVAENFRIRDYKKLEYPLTLVLGEEREGYWIDHSNGAGTIHLQKWDEARFASAAVMITLDHVLSSEQFHEVVLKTLKRFRNTSPVTVSEAKNRR